jgi:hypothetical protein
MIVRDGSTDAVPTVAFLEKPEGHAISARSTVIPFSLSNSGFGNFAMVDDSLRQLAWRLD